MITTQSNNFEGAFHFKDGNAIPRPLYINFNDLTEGDQEFKKQLGTEIILNLREIKQSLTAAIGGNDAQIFFKACHKIKFTLNLLNDLEFNSTIKDLEKDLASPGRDGNFSLRSKHFEHLCNSIIRSLNIEIHGCDLP